MNRQPPNYRQTTANVVNRHTANRLYVIGGVGGGSNGGYNRHAMTPHQAQSIIRPGQRVPYRKGSRKEVTQRRNRIARMLARGARKMEIHRRIKKQFNRQWRTVDRDIQFVRQTAGGTGVFAPPNARACACASHVNGAKP